MWQEKILNFFKLHRKKSFSLFVGAGVVILLFAFQFVVYGNIKIPVVVSVSPEGEVSPESNLEFNFSSAVVEDKRVDKFYDKEENIILRPKIPGKYKWVSNKKLRLFPYSRLKGATNYLVTIKPEICLAKNKWLIGKKKFKFNTPSLTIMQANSTYVYTTFPSIKRMIEWEIDFNYEVEPEDLKAHTSVYSQARLISKKLTYQIQPANIKAKRFKIITEPIEIKEDEEEEVVIRISKGLKPAEGKLGIEVDFLASHTITGKLKINEVYSHSEENLFWIKINFSSCVSAKLAQEYIQVNPKVKFDIEEQGNCLNLSGNFKPGEWYEVTILKGLMANDGTSLHQTFTQNVKIEDLEPFVKFEHQGKYLLRKGELNVSIKSTNIKKILVEVKLIFANNLVHLLNLSPEGFDEYEYYYEEYLSKKIYSEEINLQSERNKVSKTIFNLERFLETKRKGVFNLVVRDSENMWCGDGVVVIITDLGIIAKKSDDHLFVWINSLKKLTPIADVKIKLISKNNQLLAEGITNDDGVCTIENLKEKIEDFEPFIIVAEKDDDFSFLKFSDCIIPTHYFDIGGKEYLTQGYQAFIYSDRGVYRPDDKANLVALVRGKENSLPERFPVVLKIFDPLNRVFKEYKGSLNEQGAVDFELNIPNYALTGRYSAKLFIADKVAGETDFQVEEFIPDRIKVTVKPDKKEYQIGEQMLLDAEGIYLFGPPAAGKRTSGLCRITAWSFIPNGWENYSFGDPDRGFQDITLNLKEATLDENGRHRFDLIIPDNIKPAMALMGQIQIQVLEEGGRAVTQHHTVNIHPYPYYIGLRALSEGYAQIGKEYKIACVSVDKNGQKVMPNQLKVSVYRLVWESILKREESGYCKWISEKHEKLIKTFELKDTEIGYTPSEYGEYKIMIEDPKTGVSSALHFYASGWGYAPWSLANPDKIKLELDKNDYQPGDTAKLLIKAPFPGKLLLSIEREKVLFYKTFKLEENTGLIDLPIREDYSPNVYLYATIIKELNVDEQITPVRAFGIIPLNVTPWDKKLNIKIASPEVIKPNTELEINISTHKPDTYLTVMAVDEGICQLTDFKTPDIFDFFYGRRRLNLSSYDIYSYLLPEIKKSLSSGGGISRKHLMPLSVKRVKPVSLYSGLIKTNEYGEMLVRFNVPQFQGQLRIMVVSFKDNCFNSAEKSIKVRDPIVLLPSLPRVLTANDSFKLPVSVYNGTKRNGQIKVTLSVNKLVSVVSERSKDIFVKANKEEVLYFDLIANRGIGKAIFKLTATGLGEKTFYEEELALRPASPVITLTGAGQITPEKPLLISLPGGWIPETQHSKLILSSLPEVKLSSGLQYLLKYPHGCLEQTTSSVFPLLYFSELAQQLEPELFKKHSAEYYLMEGIEKIQRMQLNNGVFSFWPEGRYVNSWGSIYASHFLVEAKKAGYPVNPESYKMMLNYLGEFVTHMPKNNWEIEQRVYACYVLALAGKPNRSAMSFLKEYNLKELPPYTRFQLAGAFAHSGDIKTAKAILPTEIHPQTGREMDTGKNFYSDTKSNAIMLDILVEILPTSPAIPVLVKALFGASDKKLGRWYTTQENAFALLALGKTFKKFKEAKFQGIVKINNKIYKEFSEKGLIIEDKMLAGKKIEISMSGKGSCFYYWQVFGIKEGETFPEYEKGITISRVYLDRNGNKIDLDNLKQGEIIVAKISAKAQKESLENVIICDMLPSGLEIENPRLEARSTIPWIDAQPKTDYMDMRDDRLILYTSLMYDDWTTFYYTLRVVTKGEFILPPLSAECMYNPNYTAVGLSGRIKVTN